ncbi:hypothetical protein [Bradyrhizobium sp.]|uniref:hypothetical protein n=1 Tax=Bradyrhizobium sp. TaxID=376 RepID=UPI001D4764E7|nr:hypothetical protein [Bradyrhizobium sp.]MBI5323392.1 hypothetical protein [Bradyrhizobium sp.]
MTEAMTAAAHARLTPEERLRVLRLDQPTVLRKPMNTLPVDRALTIYGALADRSEAKGVRERLSKHLMKRYIDGERDQHRLTVEGLSYLQALYREIDSRR